jgi:hypothetical protein
VKLLRSKGSTLLPPVPAACTLPLHHDTSAPTSKPTNNQGCSPD